MRTKNKITLQIFSYPLHLQICTIHKKKHPNFRHANFQPSCHLGFLLHFWSTCYLFPPPFFGGGKIFYTYRSAAPWPTSLFQASVSSPGPTKLAWISDILLLRPNWPNAIYVIYQKKHNTRLRSSNIWILNIVYMCPFKTYKMALKLSQILNGCQFLNFAGGCPPPLFDASQGLILSESLSFRFSGTGTCCGWWKKSQTTTVFGCVWNPLNNGR